MDGCVQEALKEFDHETPNQVLKRPSKVEPIHCGQKVQCAKQEETTVLTKEQINFMQTATGRFRCHAKAVDQTVLHALNDAAASKNTESASETTKHFLNCAACNPNAKVTHQLSDMMLKIDGDAACLACSEARSRAGGCHHLTDRKETVFNGPVRKGH